MSMISGQIDRLRTAAQTYRKMGNHSAENMLLEAADTIWQLRDDLQRANADNAKLRELVRNLIRATHPADRAELIANAAELGVEVDG